MTGFKKEIKLFDAIMLVAGTMIGSGIFIVSADIARQLGSAGYLMLVWVLAGVITLSGALSYGELTGLMPQAGGQYVFLKEAYGKLPAFLYGWTLFLVIQTGTIAAVGMAFAKFTGVLFPAISEDNSIVLLGLFKISSIKLLAIASIILLTFINTRGVRQGAIIQNVFGSTKIIAIILLIVLGFALGINKEVWSKNWSTAWIPLNVIHNADGSNTTTILSGTALLLTLGTAMVGALFSSDAWNNVSFAGDEIVNPQKTIARSLAIGTGLVTIIYLLVNLVYIGVLPVEGSANGSTVVARGIQYAANDRVGVAAAEQIGGSVMVILMAALIMVSTFGCNNGCILSGSRVYYKMAEDRLFFPLLSKLNKFNVPAKALWFQCIWACLLCLSGSYGNLLDYVMFAVLFFYIFTIATVFVFRRRMPDAPRTYKAFGYPFIPALYIVLVSAICLVLLKEKPEYTWPGFIIISLGVPVYFIFKSRTEKVK